MSMASGRTYGISLLFFICSIGAIFLPALCIAEENTAVMTLSEGLKLATESSRLVKIASLDRDVSSADVRIAFSKYLPSVNGSVSQTFQARQAIAIFDSFSVPESDKSYLSYGFDARQILYDFGGRSSHYEAAAAALDNAALNIARVKNVIALDFVNAYFDVLEAEKMILVG